MGVPELDEMLDGGLVPHRPYLLVGPSGTGKTSLALQFLCEGVRRGERSLYVTIEDPPNEVRWNHRAMRPELDAVEVFDAIPDVMRYERVPFKDISAVRQVVPFGSIPDRIRQTPEFSSVEVTGAALEQMLRTEVQHRGYSRIVIDSLTALQYFCMKGFDATVGAQTLLRFLTDLRTTTVLTVEAPLEDVETPERMLARGEVRLFRWELDGMTVRAIGVEKFRGSAHDVRLHPYRISGKGIGVQIAQTISRDTRQILEPALTVTLRGEAPAPPTVRAPAAPTAPSPATVPEEPLSEQIEDLVTLGIDLGSLRGEVEAALASLRSHRTEEVAAHLTRISALTVSLARLESSPAPTASGSSAAHALQRVSARADRAREGRPPTKLPPPQLLDAELQRILQILPTEGAAPAAPGGPVAGAAAAPAPSSVTSEESVSPWAPEPPAVAQSPPAPGGPAADLASGSGATPDVPAAPAPRRRRNARAAYSEPPPLPAVRWPGTPAPAPTAPAGTAPTVVDVAPESSVTKAASAQAPRRRRRTTPKAAPPATSEGAEAPAPAPKPRKRVVRRKKAPPVVAAAATPPPPEDAPKPPAPAAAAPEAAAPEPPATPPTEGS